MRMRTCTGNWRDYILVLVASGTSEKWHNGASNSIVSVLNEYICRVYLSSIWKDDLMCTIIVSVSDLILKYIEIEILLTIF